MNHDEIHESLGAYALGGLDEPELSEVRDHLVTCEDCRAELDRYEQVAVSLPPALAAASPVEPSDVAVQKIRRVIQRRDARSRLATIASAAALVLLLFAAVWIWRSERTLADERERSERLITEQFLMFEVVEFPDSEQISLRATDADANWYGKVFTRPDVAFVVVMANRLPETEGGREYHVWLTFDDGSTVLGGVLEPNDDGFDPLVYTADSNGPNITDVIVTAQPSGATEPTGPAVLAADET